MITKVVSFEWKAKSVSEQKTNKVNVAPKNKCTQKTQSKKKFSFVFCSCCCCSFWRGWASARLFLRTFFAASLIGRWNTVLKSSMDWTFCTVTCVRFWIDRELHYFATSSLVHREEDTRQNCGKIQRFVSISSRYGHNVMADAIFSVKKRTKKNHLKNRG